MGKKESGCSSGWCRWLSAQKYEREFWNNLAKAIEAGSIRQLDWYRWKASELSRRLQGIWNDKARNECRILEIGSGPIGIVNFLEWGDCYAIDPLEAFYRESPILTKLRRREVTYLEGTGEKLPFVDGVFSLVIIDNAIDHAKEPREILEEIHRVCGRDGLLYLAVNIHTRWGATLHRLLADLYIDRGHPHTFTKWRIQELLRQAEFIIYREESENYHEIKQRYCRSKDWKEKIKGYTGVSEFQYRAVCIPKRYDAFDSRRMSLGTESGEDWVYRGN